MRILLLLVSILALFSSPAHAAAGAAGHWTVIQRSGDARVVRAGLQPASMTVNQALAPGDTIITGATGRASLSRGGDYIVVAPRSQLRLVAKPERTGFTSIVQELGTLLYKVRHTGVPHFSVDAPMLAAVVKGTTFTVIVDQNRSAVQVIEGVVEVTAADGGMQNLVHGGRTVFIDHINPRSLITADAITLGKPGGASGEAVTISGSEGEAVLSVTAATAGQVRMEAPKTVAASESDDSAVAASSAPVATVQTAASSVVTSVLTPGSNLADVTAPAKTPVVTTPTVTAPVVTAPVVATPAITTPVVTVPAVTVPAVTPVVTTPVITTPVVTVPAITTPVVTTPAITTPVVTAPVITTPAVTVPAITTPVVTIPAITTPAVTVPAITTPVVTTPVITTPVVTVPAVTVPAITTPVVTTPVITTPAVTVPTVTVPTVTAPAVTVPTVTAPVVTVPAVTIPAVTVPAITTPVVTTPVITTPVVTVPLIPVVSLPSLPLLGGLL